jgi:hypothetical protein
VSSYQALLEQAIATRRFDDPVFYYNTKIAGRELAALAGLPTPRLLDGPAPLDKLNPNTDVPGILKPVHGCSSRGIIPLNGDQPWEKVKAQARAELSTRKNLALLDQGHFDAVRGPWIIEELLVDPTGLSNWCLYVIGGKVLCARQIRAGSNGKWDGKWWTGDWEHAGDIAHNPGMNYDPDLPAPYHRRTERGGHRGRQPHPVPVHAGRPVRPARPGHLLR